MKTLGPPSRWRLPRPSRPAASMFLAAGLLLMGQAPASGEGARVRLVPAQESAGAPSELEVTAGCVPAWVVEGRSVRRLPDRCNTSVRSARGAAKAVASSEAASRGAAPGASASSDRPGAPGGAASPSEAPSAPPAASTPSDAPRTGVARRARAKPRPRAPAPRPRVDCERQRYWVDAAGVRRLRPQCL